MIGTLPLCRQRESAEGMFPRLTGVLGPTRSLGMPLAATTAWLAALLLPMSAPGEGLRPDGVVRAVPQDAWITVVVTPVGEDGPAAAGGSSAALQTAALLFNQVRRMGVVPESDLTTAAVMDVVGSFPVLAGRQYALCLLEGDADALAGGGFRLAELQAALIIRTGGENSALESRIQHLLNTYVNTEVASVETRRTERSVSYRLRDDRLSDWAQIGWGPVGDYYVLAVGTRAFEAVVGTLGGTTPALADDPWFRSAHARCAGRSTSLEWSVRFDFIREQLRPVMAGKPDNVLQGLGLADVERGLWAQGLDGRAVEAYAVLRRGGVDDFVTLCRAVDGTEAARMVPAEATQYAALDHQPGELVRRGCDTYLASRSESAQADLRRMWAKVETETGVQTDRDLLSQLGGPVVFHDYPRHPLRIPMACTIVVPISGSPMAVRTSMDRLLRRYQRYLARPESSWPLLQLHQADDGVWYLQAGLYGPALVVADRWLVISYSPVAVRQAVALLRAPETREPERSPRAEHRAN